MAFAGRLQCKPEQPYMCPIHPHMFTAQPYMCAAQLYVYDSPHSFVATHCMAADKKNSRTFTVLLLLFLRQDSKENTSKGCSENYIFIKHDKYIIKHSKCTYSPQRGLAYRTIMYVS